MLASYLVFTLIALNEERQMNISIHLVVRNTKKLEDCFGSRLNYPYIHVIKHDMSEPLTVEAPIDYIFHAASLASSHLYTQYPVDTLSPNVIGTWSLLELARLHSCKGFIFVSSAAAYGEILEKEQNISEEYFGRIDITNLRSCYALSKQMGENMVRAYAKQYGTRAMAVRPAHTYGPMMDIVSDTRVFAEFTKNIVENSPIVLKSNGAATREFCYITDAIEGFLTVLLHGEAGQIYNVCNEDCYCTILQLAHTLSQISGYDAEVICTPRQEADAYAEDSNIIHPRFSSKKLKSLGWKPSTTIEDGFSKTIQSFRELRDLEDKKQ